MVRVRGYFSIFLSFYAEIKSQFGILSNVYTVIILENTCLILWNSFYCHGI